jgi:hypothetical protein
LKTAVSQIICYEFGKLSSLPFKFDVLGKGIAAKISSGINAVGGAKFLKNFDQWTEELSRQIVVQSDEQDMKAIGKANEIYNDDDFEEEE